VDEQVRAESFRFLDEFVEAFRTFRGAEVARRYQSPYLAVDASGAASCFATPGAIAEYFQRVLDDYRSRGCHSCRYRDLEVRALGEVSALLSVSWELLRADGSVAVEWRESYGVSRSGGRMRVFASVDHAA